MAKKIIPFKQLNFKVQNFNYNGFTVTPREGMARYTVRFNKWTTDPGVAQCICSDGKIRLIPSIMLHGHKDRKFPKQKMPKKLNMGFAHIGSPSSSK